MMGVESRLFKQKISLPRDEAVNAEPIHLRAGRATHRLEA